MLYLHGTDAGLVQRMLWMHGVVASLVQRMVTPCNDQGHLVAGLVLCGSACSVCMVLKLAWCYTAALALDAWCGSWWLGVARSDTCMV